MTSHVTFLHPELSFSGPTQRILSTASVLIEAGVRVSLLARRGSRHAAAEATGIEVHLFDLQPPRLSRPFLGLRLTEKLAELGPDLVHISDTAIAPACTRAIRRLGMPYVLSAPRPVGEPVPFAPELLQGVLVPSKSFEERLINGARLPREKLHYIPNSPGLFEAGEAQGQEDLGTARQLLSTEGDTPVIGCAGHFDEGHAHDWFLDAVRLLVRQGKNWRFLLIGEGSDEGRLRRKIRKAKLGSNVIVGVPPTRTARRTLAALDVHVGCRIDTGPGWLTAQTMRLGIPNVVAAVGEAFALVEDQRTGILVQPGDPGQLADSIAGLIANPARARALGKAGAEHNNEHAPREAFEQAVLGLHRVLASQEKA
ncbi:MAG: glycosyltransferase family 4 protein [Planctomycetota bacterium]|nr:glycosyltransferase family 4 protein [Planctomycetota bacterium]